MSAVIYRQETVDSEMSYQWQGTASWQAWNRDAGPQTPQNVDARIQSINRQNRQQDRWTAAVASLILCLILACCLYLVFWATGAVASGWQSWDWNTVFDGIAGTRVG